MTNRKLQWLKFLYERHVLHEHRPEILADKDNKVALNCTHWAYLLYHTLHAKNKVIKRSSIHSVCVIDNIHIDLECNAFIKNFDWDNCSNLENAIIVPINPDFTVKHHLIKKFYSSKCEYTFKISIIYAEYTPTLT